MLSDILRILKRALLTTLGNPGVVIPVLLVPSLLLGFSDTFIFEWLNIGKVQQDSTMEIVKVALAWQGTALVLEILYGPILAATAVYLGRGVGPPSLYGALNFALNRYGRLLKWHGLAYLLISLGMIVVLPGILYQLNYAFVDSVCCIEEEKWPLSRSTKLTRGRRKRIFFFFLPLFVYMQASMLLYLELIHNWMAVAGLHLVTYSVLFVLAVAMYVLYEERTSAKAKVSTPEPQPASGGGH